MNPLESWCKIELEARYQLDIVQSPIRARTCGFGTKDRRPLAPAAVAKLTVRHREDNSIVNPEEVDIAFFVAMVELWSSDGTENRTMVADPSAVASALATQPTYTRRRRRGVANAPGGHTVVSGSVLDITFASGSNANLLQGDPAYMPSTTGSSRSADSDVSSYTTQPLNIMEAYPAFEGPRTTTNPSWSHQYWQQSHTTHSAEGASSPPQQQFGTAPPRVVGPSSVPSSNSSPTTPVSVRAARPSVSPRHRPTPSPTPPRQPLPPESPTAINVFTSFSNEHHSLEVNNLLGPIHTNAARLLDEQDRLGIFFVFQDLSIRTEGEFRLKVKLLTVAPIGAHEITYQETAVLAEAWTDVFTVYPPKRFPGVPGTTALSATFGRQGQRFPSRNRPLREDLELVHRGEYARQGHSVHDEYDDEDEEP